MKLVLYLLVGTTMLLLGRADKMGKEVSETDSIIDKVESIIQEQASVLRMSGKVEEEKTAAAASKTEEAKISETRFQEAGAEATAPPPKAPPAIPGFDFQKISNPPYVQQMGWNNNNNNAAPSMQQMRFASATFPGGNGQGAQSPGWMWRGGNNAPPTSGGGENYGGFINAPVRSANMMHGALGTQAMVNPGYHPSASSVASNMNAANVNFGGSPPPPEGYRFSESRPVAAKSKPEAPQIGSRFVTAPAGGIPPPMTFAELSSRVSVKKPTPREVLDLESIYRSRSGVRTNEAGAGNGRASFISEDDSTNSFGKFRANQAGSMPQGENDGGAARFEYGDGTPTTRMISGEPPAASYEEPERAGNNHPMRFRRTRAGTNQQQMRNMRAMYNGQSVRMPSPARGVPKLYNTPMGPDVATYGREDAAEIAKKTEVEKYEEWKRAQDGASDMRFASASPSRRGNADAVESLEQSLDDGGNADKRNNLRASATSDRIDDPRFAARVHTAAQTATDFGYAHSADSVGLVGAGTPSYDNSVKAEPEALSRRA
eukprot:g1623.t1